MVEKLDDWDLDTYIEHHSFTDDANIVRITEKNLTNITAKLNEVIEAMNVGSLVKVQD